MDSNQESEGVSSAGPQTVPSDQSYHCRRWLFFFLFFACEDLGGMFDNSFPPALFFSQVETRSRKLNSTAKISPQWLSELRRLWPGVLPLLLVLEEVVWADQ